MVARISNDCRPQLPVGGEDIPGPAVSDYLGAVRTLQKVDQPAPVVGRGVRSPCSDSDESDDDVLSVGPRRPLLFAAPLGGAIGHNDYMIQEDPLRDEWSVYSGTAGDRYGTSCVQLDDFDWVMPADYPVGVMPKSEEDDSLSDIEPEVCDVPDAFPVGKEMAAVESLCFPVVVPTRPQGGCDPVLPLSKGRGRNGQKAMVFGRVYKVVDPDVSRGICMEPDLLPVVMSTDDVEPMAVPVVTLTRSRVEGPLVVAPACGRSSFRTGVHCRDVRCQSWHLYGTGPPSGCDVHG